MRILNISAQLNHPKNALNMRFQQGTGIFSDVYFIVDDLRNFKDIQHAVSYAFFGLDNDEFSYNSSKGGYLSIVSLADDSGSLWEVRRKNSLSLILENNKRFSGSIEKVFSPSKRKEKFDPTRQFNLGTYHLSSMNDSLYMSPIIEKSQNEETTFNFIEKPNW